MTKKSKVFRIVACVLLGLTMLWTAFVSYAFFYSTNEDVERRYNERYGLYVGGVDVTYGNAHDILGDGTASYDAKANKLTLNNFNIEYEYTIIYSEIDLLIELVGENRLVCKNSESGSAIYVSNGILRKDVSFDGDGTLEIVFENVSESGTGIVADDLWIGSDITITTPDCSNISNGIVCTSSLILRNNAHVTVNNGAARSSTAVSVRGDAIIEAGSTLDVTAASGSTEVCNGICIDGNLTTGKNAAIRVAVEDESAESSNCLSVTGEMSISRESTVTASAQKAYAVDCKGSVSLSKNATLTAETEGVDIFCNGVFVNYGATVNGEIDALGGIHSREAR